MKKDRKELYPLLTSVMKQCAGNRSLSEKVVKMLASKLKWAGKAISILHKNTPIQMINDIEFTLLVMALFEATKDSRLEPSKFFNEIEIERANNYTIETPKVSNIITIQNVDQQAPNVYVCNTVLRTDVAKWFNQGLITVNLNTQRPAKKIKFGNEIFEMADIDTKSVENISQDMLKGLFVPNTVTLNLRKTGLEKPLKYDKTKRTLQIYVDNETNFLDMPDGIHRTGGFIVVAEKDPKHTGLTGLRILYYEEKDVHRFIRQEATHNDIPEETLEYFNTDNKFMELTKTIDAETGINSLFRKFAKDIVEVNVGEKYVTYNTFSSALEEFFTIPDGRKARLLKDFLIEGFNEITGIFEKEFKDINIAKEYSTATENNMFIAYLFILSKVFNHKVFKGVDKWQNKLEEILDKIDFNKTENEWETIGIYQEKTNKTVMKKIVNYFDEIC